MGVTKLVLNAGDGKTFPKKNDKVAMEYTGWLYDESAVDNKGKEFDSSKDRGDLVTEIGVGRVIKGWDEGITGSSSTEPMSLGEKATLTITSDYAYGARGFPGIIPPNSKLIFDVKLNKINEIAV